MSNLNTGNDKKEKQRSMSFMGISNTTNTFKDVPNIGTREYLQFLSERAGI